MFEFLKNVMNFKESELKNDINLVHRVLKTDIKKLPNADEDETFFSSPETTTSKYYFTFFNIRIFFNICF